MGWTADLGGDRGGGEYDQNGMSQILKEWIKYF